jgi:ATP-dependent Clp protease protease subunit
VEGLQADDARTESILRQYVSLTDDHWAVHAMSDLHLTARDAEKVQLVTAVRDFMPPKGKRVTNI